MTKPTIHINGTSRNDLFQMYLAAASALRRAITAVEATAPNGRDYYPQGEDAIRRATDEHRARCEALYAVSKELNELRRFVIDSE